MKTDQGLLAILLAMTAGPLIEGYTTLMKHLGFTTITALETLSMMWQREPSQPVGTLGIFGIVAWNFLLLYYSANFWGTDYFPIKAAFILLAGVSLLFHIYGVLGRNELLMQNVSGSFVHATAAVLTGTLIGFLMKRFLSKRQAS